MREHDNGPLLNVKAAAAYLATTPATLRRNWRVWGLVAYRTGHELKFRQGELDAWIETRRAA